MRQMRHLPRGTLLIWVSVGLSGIVALLFWSGLSVWRFSHRVTVAFIGRPVSILSFDPENQDVTIILLSPDHGAQAVNGYGIYTLSSLWSLGTLEKKEGKILTESLSEAVGLPISSYVGPTSDVLADSPNPLELFTSYTVMQRVLSGTFQTDASLMTLLLFTRALRSVVAQNIRLVDLTSAAVTRNESLPDESVRMVLDEGKIDAKLAHIFESSRMRSEDIRLSVVNTTSVSGLAQRAARTMGNLGMIVTSIENDEPPIDECLIITKSVYTKAYTIRRLAILFDCAIRQVNELERVEAQVRIGNTYARKFSPSVN